MGLCDEGRYPTSNIMRAFDEILIGVNKVIIVNISSLSHTYAGT